MAHDVQYAHIEGPCRLDEDAETRIATLGSFNIPHCTLGR